MKIKVSWAMNFFDGIGSVPQPDSYVTAGKMRSYAKEHNVRVSTACSPKAKGKPKAIGGGGEARIFFEGADVRDLLKLSRMAEKAMLDHQFGVTSPIVPRREFVGEGVEAMNILLEQIAVYRKTLQAITPQLEGGILARGFGALEVGRSIDQLLQAL